jgi:hypothetical protein
VLLDGLFMEMNVERHVLLEHMLILSLDGVLSAIVNVILALEISIIARLVNQDQN